MNTQILDWISRYISRTLQGQYRRELLLSLSTAPSAFVAFLDGRQDFKREGKQRRINRLFQMAAKANNISVRPPRDQAEIYEVVNHLKEFLHDELERFTE